MRIAVTGGTGFVGRSVVRTLLARGHDVRILSRDPRRVRVEDRRRVELVTGTLADAGALRRLVEGVDALVHLVGIIVEHGRETFEAVHVAGTRAIVDAAVAAKCARFVHMSALGARDEAGATAYHRTKARAEHIVLTSGLPAVALRPAIISGPGSEPIRTLVRLHRFLPVVPVFGDGSYPMQPVWIDDVALAFALAAESSTPTGVHELGGPQTMTYAEFVRTIGRVAGHPRPLLRVPLPVARAAATALSALGRFAPLTRSQLQMLLEGAATSRNALVEVFGVTPLPFEEGLHRFLP